MQSDLLEAARNVVKLSLAGGATDVECTLSEGDEFTVGVRMREIETLKEAGSKGAGVRVLLGTRVGSSYTSDLTREGLERMVKSALELAALTSEDPHAGMPEESGCYEGDLQLYSDDVHAIDTPTRIQQARDAEEAAFAVDPRIVNSEGATFGARSGARYFANSRGFEGWYRASACSISTVPVAKENGSMERDYWYSASRSWAGLEKASEVGRIAARRALRRLGARKVATQRVPVVFEPRTAGSLLGTLFDAVAGDSIYRHASFLVGKLGEQIASENVTVIDDGLMPGLFGSQPFDDEGVPTRRTPVVENGVLKSYLLNSYTARKLGLKTTGNASRGLSGNASVGHGNFYLKPGVRTAEQLIADVRNGFYVTELIGSGVNVVTGDWSQGAAGLWIENGELAYAVSEITIASNLKEMLRNIVAIGSDLEFRSSIAAPTLVIGEMTVSGK